MPYLKIIFLLIGSAVFILKIDFLKICCLFYINIFFVQLMLQVTIL